MRGKKITIFVPLILILTLILVESDVLKVLAQQINCTTATSSQEAERHMQEESKGGSSTAGYVGSGYGIPDNEASVTISMAGKEIHIPANQLANYGLETPFYYENGKFVTNGNFDDKLEQAWNFSWSGADEVNLNDPWTQLHFEVAAKEMGMDVKDITKLSETQINEITNYLVKNDGTKASKNGQLQVLPTITIMNQDTKERFTITTADLLGDYSYLLSDPQVSRALINFMNACSVGGGICFLDDSGYSETGEKCEKCDEPDEPSGGGGSGGGGPTPGGDAPTTCTKGTVKEITYKSNVSTSSDVSEPDCYTGNNVYTSTNQYTGRIACGKVVTLTTETTVINFPTSPSKYPLAAGSTFKWGNFSSKMTVNVAVADAGELTAELGNVAQKMAVEMQFQDCLKGAISSNEKKKASEEARTCTYTNYYACDTDKDGQKDETCYEFLTDWTCENARLASIADLEKTIAEQQVSLDNSITVYNGYVDESNYLNQCYAQYTNYRGYSREYNDVISLSSPVMKLENGYTQVANTIYSVSKNGGDLLNQSLSDKLNGKLRPLTESKYYSDGSYVYFTIPVNTKDGTEGTVSVGIGSGAENVYEGDVYDKDSYYPALEGYVSHQNNTSKYYKILSIVSNDAKLAILFNRFTQNANEYCSGEYDRSCYYSWINQMKNSTKNMYERYKYVFDNLYIDDLISSSSSAPNNTGTINTGALAGSAMNSEARYTADVKAKNGGSFVYKCPLTVTNDYICGDECPETGGINVIYRPISLTNPFPNAGNSSSRKLGSNWTNSLVDLVIENNRGVNNYEVYNVNPLYTITLTPSTITKVRSYNDSHEYSDFELNCDASGNYCTSPFIRQYLTDLGAVDASASCALNSTNKDSWFDCFVNEGGSY